MKARNIYNYNQFKAALNVSNAVVNLMTDIDVPDEGNTGST